MAIRTRDLARYVIDETLLETPRLKALCDKVYAKQRQLNEHLDDLEWKLALLQMIASDSPAVQTVLAEGLALIEEAGRGLPPDTSSN